MEGGGGRVGDSTIFGSAALGLGAGRCRRVVFASDVHVRSSGATRGSD
jgi:hypothetical protein